MNAQRFVATARFEIDVQDIADEGAYGKSYSFSHPEELMLFMKFVDEARAKARIHFAHASNELE
jgi:hypothetical protein